MLGGSQIEGRKGTNLDFDPPVHDFTFQMMGPFCLEWQVVARSEPLGPAAAASLAAKLWPQVGG